MASDTLPHPVMTVEELNSFMEKAFPHQAGDEGPATVIEEVAPLKARVRLRFREQNLRPGGTLSGPSMMALADQAMYAVVLAHIGPVALAVTTNLNINFLSRPAPEDLFAEAHILKLGQRLIVGDVTLSQVNAEGPVAHATLTYSVPPERYRGVGV